MKKNIMRGKKRKKDIYNDSWMYILLLITLVILTESLKTYTFNVGNADLTYSVFLLPIIYFLTNYITRKYDYRKGVAAICLSAVSMVLFIGLMNITFQKNFTLISIVGEFCGYVVSQFVNLTLYYFVIKNTTSPYLLLFTNYIFSLVVFYMVYTFMALQLLVIESYWIGYFITLTIQIMICLVLSLIDFLEQKGREN